MNRLFEAVDRVGKELHLVGGAVRDLALGIEESKLDDLDFCTNARPEESLQVISMSIAKDRNFGGLEELEQGILGVIGDPLGDPRGRPSEDPSGCSIQSPTGL